MNVYVVFCHPTHESFMGAVLERTVAGLESAGHDVQVSDLHADGFEPSMSADARAAHFVDHRLDLSARPGIEPYVGLLRWCDALVLVHPTWWSGQPAMLKGWFDRVLVRGVAWDVHPRSGRLRPLLRNVRRISTVTSHGSSKLVNAVQGEGGKRIASRSIRLTCSPFARTRWIALYGIDRSTEVDRNAFLDRVERAMARPRL